MASDPPQRDGLPAGLRHRSAGLHSITALTTASARLALRPRAAALTVGVLTAALVRQALTPLGESLATATFAVLLAAMIVVAGTGSESTAARWSVRRSVIAGIAVATALAVPPLLAGAGSRGLSGFIPWALVTGVVASLEEVAIRGTLQQAWTREVGPFGAILAGALVFAAIHLPHYGLGAMPLDLVVGVALGALRQVSGRILPCSITHTLADWVAWFTP